MTSETDSLHDQSADNGQLEKWLVRLESGEIKGPYNTEVVRKMILEGFFSGLEEIASYPEGDWKPLSKQIEFYESLIESLENPVERDDKKTQKMEADTVVRTSPIAKYTKSTDEDTTIENDDEFTQLEKNALIVNSQTPNSNNQEDKILFQKKLQAKEDQEFLIKQKELFRIEKEKLKEKKSKILRKLFFTLSTVIIVSIIYLSKDYFTEPVQKKSWKLITPQLSEKESVDFNIKEIKLNVLAYLKKGIIDDLIQSQSLLIKIVEAKKNDTEALGLLCINYLHMWPFTKQDSQDLKAISTVYQQVKQVSPLSGYTNACHAVYLLIKSQNNDGRAVLEKTLDSQQDSSFLLYPFLYYIKGELLEESDSLINSQAYFIESLKQFPNWVMAEYKIGRVLYKQNKFSDAEKYFQNVLSRNPLHKPSLYALALSKLKLNDVNNAIKLFEKGYSIRQTVPKALSAEALIEYGQLLVSSGQNKKALDVVRKALSVSPSHRALNDLFITLGGEALTIGAAQVTELTIEGDQFFRISDYLAAQGRYRAAFENDKKNTLLALKIAKCMRALNQFNDSIKWINTALEIDPKYFPAYALKADFLIQRYNFADAERTLMLALKIDANNYEVLKMMTKLQWKKNNLAQGLNYGFKAYKIFDVDVELLTLLATIYIDQYFTPGLIGNTESSVDEKIKQLEGAQKFTGRAIEIEPAWPESQITYAKYLFAKEGSQRAEKYYAELIKVYPYTMEYRIAFAEFYELQEKLNPAIEIYKFVLETNPKNTKASLGLARSYKNKGDYKIAIRHYMTTAALDPADSEPMFSIAALQLEMSAQDRNKAPKLLAESLGRLELVKSNNPNYPKLYYFIAKNKVAQGLYDEARKDIETEKLKNPFLADSYILKAELDLKQNQYTECAKEYMTVIKLRPISDYYFKAAACNRLANQLDLAEELISEGKKLESGNFTYFRELGLIHEARGDIKSAIQSLSDYLHLTAKNSFDAKEIESKIVQLSQIGH